MKIPLEILIIRNAIWRNILCRLGFHGPKVTGTGEPANFCHYGCGRQFRSDEEIYSTYKATLVTGEIIEVDAISETHARSLVIKGGCKDDLRIVRNGGEILIHPRNIVTVVKIK